MATQILLLTGMTPDARIFERLSPLLPTAYVVPWISPAPHERIQDYACRLADSLSVRGGVVVSGVSFGGIIAQELAIRLNAKACVLISSVRGVRQLPPWFQILRPFAIGPVEAVLSAVGTAAYSCPARLRTHSTARLTKLAGEAGAWHRWATASALRWVPSRELEKLRIVQIHGDRDTTFPMRYVNPDVVIANGGHVLPLTHPAEIAAVLRNVAA
jgi:pimeloyl-ACP methyl ester carboxylesterase